MKARAITNIGMREIVSAPKAGEIFEADDAKVADLIRRGNAEAVDEPTSQATAEPAPDSATPEPAQPPADEPVKPRRRRRKNTEENPDGE